MKRHDVRIICSVCARQGQGFGYAPPHQSSAGMLWCCSPECQSIAKDTHHMTEQRFNRIEGMAVTEGGNEAGAFLEGLGKTDLMDLTPEEWQAFCRTMVDGYRNALRNTLKDEAPF